MSSATGTANGAMPDESESETHYENDIDVDDMMEFQKQQREERQKQKEERRQRKEVRRQLREERKNSQRLSSSKLAETGIEEEPTESSMGTTGTNTTGTKSRNSKRQIAQHPNYGVGFDNDTGLVIGDMGREGYRMDSADYRDASRSELRAEGMPREGSRRSYMRDNSSNSNSHGDRSQSELRASVRDGSRRRSYRMDDSSGSNSNGNISAKSFNANGRSWRNSASGRILGAPDDQPQQKQQKNPDDRSRTEINLHNSQNSHNFEMDQESDDEMESQRERELFDDEFDEHGNKKLTDFSGMCVFILFVVGLTVGITCQSHGCSAKSGSNINPALTDPTAPSTPAPLIFTTPIPTLRPTQSPTESPTQLMQGLPPVTLEALENPNSPQSKALQWIENDPFLELYSNKRRVQRFALATLYYATNGPTSWVDQTNWLRYGRDNQECTWFSAKDNRIYPEYETDYNLYPCSPTFDYIFLTPWNNGMSGTIPPELGLLTKLQVLDLTQGSIRGTLPSELGLLTDLRKVWLAALQLTGTLPSTFFTAWSNLEGIGLYSNKLSGSIPTEIGLATPLTITELYINDFSGPIPSELGVLGRLSNVQIDNNKLSAVMPTELGMATALTAFMAWENRLTGSIPSELGQLSNLKTLLLSGNSLSSTLPVELMYGLGKLQGLLLARNQLDGIVNDYYFASDSLVLLHLEGNNRLVGTFPQTLCSLESGLIFNCNPATLCGCTCECSNNRTGGTSNNNGGRGRRG